MPLAVETGLSQQTGATTLSSFMGIPEADEDGSGHLHSQGYQGHLGTSQVQSGKTELSLDH